MLLEYKNKHGYTLVPQIYEEEPKLGKWVSTQRTAYDKKEVLVRRVRRLNSIGFIWKQYTPWIDMYQRLVSYKEDHDGSTLVPRNYDADPTLRNWVHEQRKLLRKNKLSKDRATLLRLIDFTLNARKATENNNWMAMYQRLVSYKEEHNGSTLVPLKYDQDPVLGRWVRTQRRLYKKQERVNLLNDIHFVWCAK